MNSETFNAVIERARCGDEFAWSVLYDHYAPPLRGYVGAQGARDVDGSVGDVFLDLARNVSRFTGDEASFRSWIFMIAHNRVIDARRRQSRSVRAVDSPALGNAEEAAVTNLRTEEVVRILGRLSAEQRDVLCLRIVADLSVAETARILGKTETAVKAAQRRGLNRLRDRSEILGVTP